MAQAKLLILCTGNSCRSQMAEGLFRHQAKLMGKDVEVCSAGVETHGLNPKAVEAMAQIGIDISKHESQHVDTFLNTGITHVITVCDHAREVCPFFPEEVKFQHAPFRDPSHAKGTHTEVMAAFSYIRNRIEDFAKDYLKQF